MSYYLNGLGDNGGLTQVIGGQAAADIARPYASGLVRFGKIQQRAAEQYVGAGKSSPAAGFVKVGGATKFGAAGGAAKPGAGGKYGFSPVSAKPSGPAKFSLASGVVKASDAFAPSPVSKAGAGVQQSVSAAKASTQQQISVAQQAAQQAADAGNSAAVAQAQATIAQLQSQLSQLQTMQGGGGGLVSGGGGGGGGGGGEPSDITSEPAAEAKLPPAAEPKKGWWESQSTGMKVAIVGVPAALLLVGAGYLATRKKPAAATVAAPAPLKANKRRAKSWKCKTCAARCKATSRSCYRCGAPTTMRANGLIMRFGKKKRPLSARQIERVVHALPPRYRTTKLASIYQFSERKRRKMKRNGHKTEAVKRHAKAAYAYVAPRARKYGRKAAKHSARGVAWMLHHGASGMAHMGRTAHAWAMAPNKRRSKRAPEFLTFR